MKTNKRLTSLDAFRGLTIAGMILVNTPGSWTYVYAPLRHAEWHGCTPTDLVFPFFLFIVGVSMWFSFRKFDHKMSSSAFRKLGKRAAMIFLIGLFLNVFPFYTTSFETFRIMGVLQRIAVAFFFGALICLSAPKKWLPAIAAAILLAYWGIMAAFGGAEPYSLQGNFARTVDIALLSESHLYGGFGIPFDPEGLLSSIPAVGTVIIGFLIGQLIDRGSSMTKAVQYLIGFGIGAILIALVWDRWFPINKPLWTSSYVLYTAGIASVLLAFFYWLIEYQGWKKWASPLVVFGVNPLFIYALSIILVKILIYVIRWQEDGETMTGYGWVYQHIFVPIAGNLNGSLLFGLTYVALHWLVAWILWNKKIFIKV